VNSLLGPGSGIPDQPELLPCNIKLQSLLAGTADFSLLHHLSRSQFARFVKPLSHFQWLHAAPELLFPSESFRWLVALPRNPLLELLARALKILEHFFSL
jgi:hypothetical protein